MKLKLQWNTIMYLSHDLDRNATRPDLYHKFADAKQRRFYPPFIFGVKQVINISKEDSLLLHNLLLQRTNTARLLSDIEDYGQALKDFDKAVEKSRK